MPKKNEKERERCALCSKITEYTKNTPITLRAADSCVKIAIMNCI